MTDGSYIVVWNSEGQDGSGSGVYGQHFTSAGVPIGPEFRVNTVTDSTQGNARVAATGNGGFVVTWEDSSGIDGSGQGVIGQRYDASGLAAGSNFVVNATTSSTQNSPATAGYGSGFALVWSSFGNAGGNGYDIFLRRFDNAGNQVAAETLISTVPGAPGTAQVGTQTDPDVASYANGDLVIVWTDQSGNDGSSYGVYGRRVTAAGVLSDTFLINTFTANAQYEARVATLSDGGFVVVWRSDLQDGSSAGVYGQRFTAAGAKVGPEFLVNQTTTGGQYQPEVTGLSTGGFVITWYNDNFDVGGSGTTQDVYVREYDASGNPVTGQVKLVSPTSSTEYQPAIADLGQGNYVVVYQDVDNSATGNGSYEIVQQIFGDPLELSRQASPTVGDFSGTVTFAENLVNAAPQVIDPAVSVTDLDSVNFAGGRLDLFYVQGGEVTDQLSVRNQGNGFGQIGVSGSNISYGGTLIGTIAVGPQNGVNGANLVINLNANATTEAVEGLIQNLTYASISQSPAASRTVGIRLSDGDGGASPSSSVTINVTADLDGAPVVHGEETVNTYRGSTQDGPQIAVLSDGSYVTVWNSEGQDGSSTGVYGQRYTHSGVAVGNEFKINAVTSSTQANVRVAAKGDGGFVVTWDDSSGVDGSGQGVIGQLYDAGGVAVNANFVVNATTSSTQNSSAAAGYSSGFAVVWSSNQAGGNGSDIYLRRFDNAGNQVAAETRISTVPGAPGTAQVGTQTDPDVAAYANGNLVVVWTDQSGNDGNVYGVYGRTVSAGGTLSDVFLINTYTTSYQYEARVATLSDGGFVVVWRSDNQDGSSAGVYGQRYNAAGTKVGDEFQVNESTNGGQYQPDVTGLSTGGFVVTWYNDNYDVGGTGTTADVYIREYAANGTAIDGQRKLVSATNSTEYQPAIADLGGGNFVVAYADWNTVSGASGVNTYEIAQQLFGSAAQLPRQANPVLGDVADSVTFGENLVNTAPQVIDAAIALDDADSANFGGGRVDLSYAQGGDATDQLGVRNQGNGAGQIGVSGSTVSYGGVAIGSIAGASQNGVNGANLVINLNVNATVEAVEALIQNLTYASTSQNPPATRTVGLRVSDGDGGASQASTITINVVSELEINSALVVHGEETVNTYRSSTQDGPQIAVLSDGSYVTVWNSEGQDGNSTGVYGQRFTHSGVAVGNEFKINTVTSSTQANVRVAAKGDGGFVVTWDDSSGVDGSGQGVVGQLYDANGLAVNANFVVNTTTSSTQNSSSAAGYTSGFAVVWSSLGNVGGNGYDIYLRRFDNAGNQVAAETRISTVPGAPGTAQVGTQTDPDVASYANGNLVIVWADQSSNDGSVYGVYGRTVSAAGALSDVFLINTATTSYQYEARVATLSDGGFVVVWRSDNQDGNGAGVYGQRYNAAATKVGGEFQVNESTFGGQYQPDVTGLSTGGFVVTWYNDNYDVGGTGTTADVYIREYAANGTAIDGQRKLVSATNSTEYQPAIADLGGGNFVVAYADWNTVSGAPGVSTYEIAQQLFGNAAQLARPSAAPILDDLRTLRTLTNVAGPNFAGDAQLIDSDVHVSDVDSANFNTGQFVAQLLNGATATEALGIRNQGIAAGQIGVSGANITYGGVVIGSFSGGGVGASTLTVTFNASADPAAVRALVENITYQNTSPPAGTTHRYIGFRLSDGDGGVSDSHQVQLTIQASFTPASTIILDDLASAVTFTESQANAGVRIDDALQLDYTGPNTFNGGKLLAQFISSTGRTDDQLSIRHEGAGVGQVGVSGSIVSYGGTNIGTISATLNGVNGVNLEITFNASATAEGIERVAESLVYGNSSEGPNATRTVRITVSDSANVTSAAQDVVITVTPETDPAATAKLLGEQQSNTYEGDEQSTPAVARLEGVNAGGYVVTWVSQGAQDGDLYGVFAQRYSASGAAVGPEFQVNSQTLGYQYEPAVAGLSNGGYVIVWRSDSQDGSGTGVYAQRFDASGVPAGTEFRANTTTSSNQYQPAVVALSGGGFVIAWYDDGFGDVRAQRYASDGSAAGAEFTINTLITGSQFEPQLSALSTGGFVAVWTSTDASGQGIAAQRFDAAGSKIGPEIAVNTTTSGTQNTPDVAGLAAGGFVAVWESGNSVFLQRFDAAGNKVGPEVLANNVTDAPANTGGASTSVAALASGGFVVTWGSSHSGVLGGSGYDVFMQQFDATGVKIDGARLVNTTTASTQYVPDIAALTGENFVIAWQGYNQERGTANSYGVFHQLFGTAGSITQGAAPVITDVTASVTFAENLVNATPQIIDSGISVTDSDSPNFDGGRLWVSVISGYGDVLQSQLPDTLVAQDQLGIRNQGTGAGQVGVSGGNVSYGGVTIGTVIATGSNGADLVVQFNINASAQAVEAVIENLTYANSSSAPVASRTISISVSDGDGSTSVPRIVQINVTPEFDGARSLFDNEIVNTYRPDTQDNAAMARLSDGGYVTVWQSNSQDGWSNGVHGQRYDAKGVPVGSEFQINTYTPGQQYEPTVAGLNGGGFVVAWRSDGQDGSGAGVYAQRFDANGVPVGNEFLVNSTTSSNQYQPTLIGTADGGFVVAWYHDSVNVGGEYYDIFFQRYNASGVAQGGETRGNPTGLGTVAQSEPSLAALSGGGFVLTWTDQSTDGSGNGVFAQRFNANGTTAGSSFQVNTFTTGDQSDSHVVGLTGGGFVVVWRSTGQDGGGSYGVFGQIYNSAGVAVGGEFRVNTETAGNEYEPTVTALSHGGFAVAWNDDGRIRAQQFDANGLRLDGPALIDTHDANGSGSAPVVLGLANGAFVVSWTDYDYAASGGDNTYQIFQQLYGNPADFVRQANPLLVDVAPSVTFAENTVNATPQLIDPGVGLFDADSANFDGGLLEVNYLTDYGAQDQLGLQGLDNQDQLGIRNEGSGAGQVGVSGNTVSFAGVAIGTILSNGANGDKLTVQFNTNATPDAVEQLIENLTYANTVSNPIASRTISIRVSDGDGGASDARSVQINVTPQTDGAVPLGAERIVNSARAGQQVDPAVARLSDGGYVVVWVDQNGNDGASYGVYGQRYDANDNAVGPEFRANSFTTGAQYETQVAGLSGGGFVVIWRSDGQDGSGAGVYAQRYLANGSAVGPEFRVNTTTASNQYMPDITATTNGGFVVTWYHDGGSAGNTEFYDVFFQRYDASGVTIGPETRANPAGLGFTAQYQPGIAWNTDGSGFVVVWRDDAGDGNGAGVFGQRFDASGATLGGRFQINAYTNSTQEHPSVAALKGGGFIVVWESEGQDLSGTGIYAQRYDAAGVKVGAEFRVNTTINSTQNDPRVAALENGGWVVTWADANGTDGSGWGVMMQQYNAAGQAVDHETVVNTYRYSTQNNPAIASMADGGFVVAYSGHIASWDANSDGLPDGGNDTQEIRLQRFSNTAPTISDVALTTNEEQLTTLSYAFFSAGFNDPDGQPLVAVRITTLPGEGVLRLNNIPVAINQEIQAADLQAGLLTYQGNLDYFGLDQFRWTGSDGIAFAATPVFTNITIQNVNDGPRLEAGNNGNSSEGAFFTRTITLDDPDPEGHQLTIDWGDGTAPQVLAVGNTPTHNIGHTYYENATYAVTVTANDQQGQPNSIEVDSFQVVVANAAPTISLSGNLTVVQGNVYTLDLGDPVDPANFGGPIRDTVTEYRINWGDGTPQEIYNAAALPANGILTHTYGAAGPQTINVTLVDEDGVHANAGSKSITVAPPAEVLTVNAGADIGVNEGASFAKTITFTDPTDTNANGRTYIVNWGDGLTSTGSVSAGVFSFNIGHTYADGANNYTATVTVDDDGAQQGSDSFAVSVNNIAPTVSISGAGSVNEGSVYSVNLTRFDPGSDTATQYTVRWGDGTADTVLTASQLAAQSGNVTHTYADGNASRTITVDVVDEDGAWIAAGSHNVFVSNVAPTASVTGADAVSE
ncbi:MAG TPA: PKD domain-containing protein, partial [Accumulibacter sp.]|nr:PKD domain-containing protein [Accumulibacter sp.]